MEGFTFFTSGEGEATNTHVSCNQCEWVRSTTSNDRNILNPYIEHHQGAHDEE